MSSYRFIHVRLNFIKYILSFALTGPLEARVLKNMKMSRDTNMAFVITETGMSESGLEWIGVLGVGESE